MLLEMAAETATTVIEVEALRWRGRSNVIAAASTMLLDLMTKEG